MANVAKVCQLRRSCQNHKDCMGFPASHDLGHDGMDLAAC